MRCFVFLYLLSFASYGSSCVQSDEQVAAWSSKYAHLFDVSTQINNNSFFVYVDFPVTIEEKAIHSVWVVVGDPNDPLIALPIAVFEEDRKKRAWFFAKPIDNEVSVTGTTPYGVIAALFRMAATA
ncbi:hypothetical protein M2404_002957 [Rheinheimera pacifica]|uniref:hypothetical protein n=1 Tax=Rheinheimera pacifica TaxID=173990 RepID=UPI002168D4F3|nr:hypothetical protein [Rheinheimera pacifica]MCS4308600.1 hypothetical protein [Rheinheimera pacifica]